MKTVRVLVLLILFVGIGYGALRDFPLLMRSERNVEDFIVYWASGRLLLEGKNPYASEPLFDLQKRLGWSGETPLLTFNPPWGIAFVLPFCTADYLTGKILWLFCMLSVVVFSTMALWRYYDGPVMPLTMFFTSFAYAPTIMVLKRGQIVPFVLLGAVLFLLFERRNQDFLAGMASILLTIKPHTAYLFWPVLLLWVLQNRRWHVLAGLGCALLATVSISWILYPEIIRQYAQVMSAESPAYRFATPAVGTYLRLLFGGERRWLQFLSVVAGFFWVIGYWRARRHDWQWGRELPLLMLVSPLTSAYIWLSDYCLFLPAVIQVAVSMLRAMPATVFPFLLVGYAGANTLPWLMHSFVTRHEVWYIWIGLVTLAVYLFLRQRRDVRKEITA